MTKNFNCTKCRRRIKIDGATDSSREVSQLLTCPFCETPNEVEWSINTGYIVAG